MEPNPGPAATRPVLPEGYGLPSSTEGLLSWPEVEQHLTVSQHYWLTTVRPDGTPHSVPRWGVWLDGRFYYDGAPTTRHARNLQNNPACTLTLESGTQVVIVEGVSTATSADPGDLGARLASAFEKYHPQYAPAADAWAGPDGGGLRMIIPRRALAWFAFPTDCTRFVFSGHTP
ncbi:pyridoxamine 5'-phosphate oxidase family protein [Mycolicibacter heraklionensis]|uniref:pyridoxamine 5'-phosphate oxidase family protein n=1 Tax=Mycolicibacter heraklionensis TaxID=512402 RepID=UPI0007E98ACA|nr:pyridoxamine 5'-phosphate oxidase family protein [Mycolicibacter heraklionensis]OBG41155.1 pyridoxamine 5'-phosphate oxidase [Mycolicibacter heraklionensis]